MSSVSAFAPVSFELMSLIYDRRSLLLSNKEITVLLGRSGSRTVAAALSSLRAQGLVSTSWQGVSGISKRTLFLTDKGVEFVELVAAKAFLLAEAFESSLVSKRATNESLAEFLNVDVSVVKLVLLRFEVLYTPSRNRTVGLL